MNVTVSQPFSDKLCFAFDMDATDAAAPVPEVWFRHHSVSRLGALRTSLMAYLMARPFIGNSFTLSGHSLAAHLASRLHQDFGTHEFFVGPVTNIPEKILPDFQYDVLDVYAEDEWTSAPGREASLTCRRNELGYVLETMPGAEAPLLSIATNVDLFTAFTEQPKLLSLVLIYLCSYDVLGIKSLRIRSVTDPEWLSGVDRLLSEVGGGICFEPARSAA